MTPAQIFEQLKADFDDWLTSQKHHFWSLEDIMNEFNHVTNGDYQLKIEDRTYYGAEILQSLDADYYYQLLDKFININRFKPIAGMEDYYWTGEDNPFTTFLQERQQER